MTYTKVWEVGCSEQVHMTKRLTLSSSFVFPSWVLYNTAIVQPQGDYAVLRCADGEKVVLT